MLFHKPPFWAVGGVFLGILVLANAFPVAQAGQSGKKGGQPTNKGAKPATTGVNLFRQQCAPCHGVNGEGTSAYPRTLTGVQSVGQLAKYIAQSMPPGPKHASKADAEKLAPYIFDAFYSPIAQERNRPARVELSRLTVGQTKNAVADLISSFRGYGEPTGEVHGLKAEYYNSRFFDDSHRLIQRTDPEVQFDFGQEAPKDAPAEKDGKPFDKYQFCIRWSGNITVADTGVYEFTVRSEHSTKLWVNDNNKPLVDAWIKSGKDTDYKGSIYLIGGRTYPIRLEFSKSSHGVDDKDKIKDKPASPASITLLWKRPKQAVEVVPARALAPTWKPENFIVTTPFPPDDRSMGYERGNSVSMEWDEATTSTALETADYIVDHLQDLAGTENDPVKLRAFCRKFVERALRRPLDKDTENLYIERQFKAAPDNETAIKRVILLTLKSPRFLYRELGSNKGDAFDTASRLSFAIWDSIPDDALLQAAASGQLTTREQVAQQAARMVADPRSWNKQRDFFLHWLKVDQTPDLVKDAKRFPNFTPAAATDLRTSFDLTLESIVRSKKSDFRELLLSDRMYLNGRLAPLYGVTMPANAPFQPVELDANARAGVLTHPYVLASFAYNTTSSPIHRGVLLTRNIMGRVLPAPPAAFTPLNAALHPDLTTRQRVTLQTKPVNCMSCHGTINSLGFTLEQFDAIGRLRTTENGKPIDATGSYELRDGKTVKFSNAQDLAKFVATSTEPQSAFVEKLFQYLVKQPIRAYGPQTLPRLQADFKGNEYNIQNLVAEIATESALPQESKREKTNDVSKHTASLHP